MLEPGLACPDTTGDLVLESIRTEANKILVAFLDQQLQHEGLDLSWGEKILPLAKKICSMVKPNVAEGDVMDIRYYVHIKRVPGGSRSECCLVKGVISTKNVAHKKMSQKQSNPRILLLQAAIEHQRVQNKLASLEPLVLQEHEYLKNCVSKIVALRPTVLVVEKSVARLAQDFLLACGISLVLNVKPRVVGRITRQTEGSSISSIDQVSAAKLGTCQNFYLQRYTLPGGFTKTLMFFDGCPGHLGCSVLLRGGGIAELSKVKRVLNLMVYAVYHSRLETSYLKDEFAKPPLTPSPAGSPPNSPPSPMGQTPGRQAMKDTGTFHEVIKAVRIEQALIRKPTGVDNPAGERENCIPVLATPPSSRRGFKATVQKLLMGKGSDGSDQSGSSSAAGSRRSSDGTVGNDRTGAPGVAAKESSKEMPGGAAKLPNASTYPSFDTAIESESLTVDAEGTGTPKKHDDATVEGISQIGADSSSSLSASENGLLQEYVLVDESKNDRDVISQSGSMVEKGGEIKVKDYQVKKISGKEEEENVFSFDVNSNDSEAEEAMESLDSIDPLKSSSEDSPSEKEDRERFSRAFNNTILTISPFLAFPAPYFETEEGRQSPNRHFFPQNVFWSPKLQDNPGDISQAVEAHLEDDDPKDDVVYWSTDRCTHKISSMSIAHPHPFTFLQLTEDFWSESTRTLLADFRARGGRYIPKDQGSSHILSQKSLMIPHEHKPKQQQNANQQYLLARKGNNDTQEHQSRHPVYDCLDPYHHQKILLQFSSYSHHSGNMPGHCIHPWMVTMEFYGYNDITLGMFLDRYCFSANYLCPSETCDTLMANHVRRFVHGNASIQVLQRQLDSPVPGYKNKVLMWSWCRRCKQVTPVQPMSRDTWHMSFAKYLEIHFYGKDYGRHGSSSPCCHSLHHHHYQYFGQHNMVASFKFSPIILREIAFPPLPIMIDQPFRAHKSYLEESKSLVIRGNQVFRGIFGNISSLTVGKPSQLLEQKEQEFTSQYEMDCNRFKQNMDEVEAKVMYVEKWKASPDKKKDSSGNDWSDFCLEDQLLDIEDSIVIAKRCLAEINFAWNTRFHDFLQQEKELEKTRKSLGRKVSGDVDTPTPTKLESSPVFISPPQLTPSITKTGGLAIKHLETLHERKREELQGRQRDDSDVSMLGDISLTSDKAARYFDYGISPGLVAGLEYKPSNHMDSPPQHANDNLEPSVRGSVNFSQGSPQTGPRLGPVPGPAPSVAPNNKRDVEKSCETVYSSSQQAAKSFVVQDDSSRLKEEMKDEGKDREKDTGMEDSEKGIPCSTAAAEEPVTSVASSFTQSLDVVDGRSPAKTKPGAVKGFLNQFLQPTGSTQIETPFPADEHHTLPPCSVIPIIVYDKEPSSIIAYALSSEQYKTKLYEVQQSRCGSGRLSPGGTSLGSAQGNSNPESGQSSPHTRRKAAGDGRMGGGPETKDLSRKIGQLKRRISQGVMMFQRTKTLNVGGANQGASKDGGPSITIDAEDNDSQERLNPDDRLDDLPLPHIELQFSDETSTQFFCGVYFAAQFQELRKIIFPVGEDVFIRSLSRCMQWVARGGKSGSKFMKTMDDRLILKQMSKSEAHSFLNFAPHYFQYIQKAHENNKPTALTKILGFYKVGFQNPVTNTAQKLDLLVQENLFYKRRIAQVFDLKGSVRNRHVKTSGVQTQDLVLLDENLLKHIVDSPLYIRMHSKTALAMAIKADTEFLSSHLVMDYSLLVGLDENTKELVIGIIDFIRTFTWDKKLETFVKSTSGKMPTVVSPEIYRNRFLEAMDKYFLLVPDRWTGLGQDAYSNS
ncbi:1-phosphatidylinositol 3-phosphate 5-kinase-like isoform X2 [Lytechinus pictus]|uniref:1-phosphatidylinositol 3-phosphate 5-kinase-like isoform X2 n=1 Tax=Lytechinus pictus TaxID=7653 RepID=UPI0030B9B249